MDSYRMIYAEQDWPLFIDIFNKCTQYAPYSIPLSLHLVQEYIVPFRQSHEDYAMIGDNGRGKGILHIGKQARLEKGGDEKIGVIYMLFGENNDITQYLLEKAEEWFLDKGLKKVLSFWWYPNPYQYILHGSEIYGWAGAYPMMNAFRRLNYDLASDILVMRRDLASEPEIPSPQIDGLEFVVRREMDNELAIAGTVMAKVKGKEIGYCGFQYLKAISARLRKGIGQIAIGANQEFHGMGIGTALITHAHIQLYQLGARQVILATNQSLFRAIKFYEKMGYQPEPIRAYAFSKDL